MFLRSVFACTLVAPVLSLLGCSCESGPPPIPLDAALPDSARFDGPTPPRDAPLADGELPPDVPIVMDDAPLADGETPDAGSGISCTFDPVLDVLELARDPIDASRLVGLAAGDTEWGVTWTQSFEGFQNVWWVHAGATGFPTATQVTSTTALQQQPTIAATSDGWVVGWYGNVDSDFEIYSRAYDASGAPRGAASNRITTRPMRDDNPMLLGLGTTVLAAFAQSEGTMTRLAVSRMLSSSGAPTAAAIPVTTTTTTVPQPILTERSGGALLGWVDSTSAMPSAMLMPLDASGASAGAAELLSTERNADGTLDMDVDGALGGAAVFGVLVALSRPEVRGRLVAGDGSIAGMPEVVLTPAPEVARDASIARFSGGYVVSYRAIVGSSAVLRLGLYDGTLTRVGSFDLVPVSPTGGRTTVRVTDEGRIMIAWADVPDATGTDIRAVRVTCD